MRSLSPTPKQAEDGSLLWIMSSPNKANHCQY
jgi:hypothetical protein